MKQLYGWRVRFKNDLMANKALLFVGNRQAPSSQIDGLPKGYDGFVIRRQTGPAVYLMR